MLSSSVPLPPPSPTRTPTPLPLGDFLTFPIHTKIIQIACLVSGIAARHNKSVKRTEAVPLMFLPSDLADPLFMEAILTIYRPATLLISDIMDSCTQSGNTERKLKKSRRPADCTFIVLKGLVGRLPLLSNLWDGRGEGCLCLGILL